MRQLEMTENLPLPNPAPQAVPSNKKSRRVRAQNSWQNCRRDKELPFHRRAKTATPCCSHSEMKLSGCRSGQTDLAECQIHGKYSAPGFQNWCAKNFHLDLRFATCLRKCLWNTDLLY